MNNTVFLRKADMNESVKILQFYNGVINSIRCSEFKPKWNSNYPDLDYIKTSIEDGELFVCSENDTIIACVVMNNRFSPEYGEIKWIEDVKSEEVTVIHTFAVDSNFSGKGIGKQIFNQIREKSIKNNRKSIRIDIIDGNIGAQKVFESFGFEYIDTVEIFHDAVGLKKFHLYELVLREE